VPTLEPALWPPLRGEDAVQELKRRPAGSDFLRERCFKFGERHTHALPGTSFRAAEVIPSRSIVISALPSEASPPARLRSPRRRSTRVLVRDASRVQFSRWPITTHRFGEPLQRHR